MKNCGVFPRVKRTKAACYKKWHAIWVVPRKCYTFVPFGGGSVFCCVPTLFLIISIFGRLRIPIKELLY